MIRRKGPILAAAVIVAFAFGWYRGLFQPDGAPATSPADEVASAPVPGAEVASSSAAQTASEVPAASPSSAPAAASAPGFDVVRVEPDGSTVIAGRGAANRSIALTDGKTSLGETRTDANGDFVLNLSLPGGTHRLQLEQEEGAVSADAAVVNVPPAGKANELLVMMERPGEASEILVRPLEGPAAQPAANASMPPEAATVAELPAADEPSPPAEETVEATPQIAATGAEAAPAGGLAVEAVEVEGGKLFIAGAVPEKSTVRVYLDDQFVAQTEGGQGERFIASAMANVAVGNHVIRADEIDAGGRVVNRVEVPFQRPDTAPMSAIASMPAANQAPAESPLASVSPPAEPADAAAAPTAPTATVAANSQAGETEVPTVVQSPLETVAARVIIRRGDTLWRISRNTYGRGSRYTVIYLANGDQIRDPNRIYPGQVFRMPDASETETRG